MFKLVKIFGHFLVISAMIIFFVLGCGNVKDDKIDNEPIVESQTSAPTDSVVLVLAGEEGKSVFYLTQQKHNVDYIESAVGHFLFAIDSLETGARFGWMYSVNDTLGTVASDRYLTHDGDVVKWHFREFE